MSVNLYETMLSEPAGTNQVTRIMERVVTVDEAPKGAQVTTDEPYEWRIKEDK